MAALDQLSKRDYGPYLVKNKNLPNIDHTKSSHLIVSLFIRFESRFGLPVREINHYIFEV